MKVTVSEKGQIVIPAKIRKKYGIEKGAKIEIREKEGLIELEPKPRNPVIALRGKYKGEKLTKELLAERARDREKENAS